MRAWIPLLTNNKHPSLAALAPELEASIKAADATLALMQELSQKLKELRSDGALRALVEKTNATRKAVCGALAKLPHEQAGLPPDFASQFFRRGPGNSPERAPTIEELTARVAELAEESAEKQAQIAELEAKAAAEAKAKAEAEAAKAKLIELEMVMANAAKEAAAVKAKLTATA